jgi:HCOMODA/2-hydroxy-3-carboxy-muconic semialdehyde decarboxylase
MKVCWMPSVMSTCGTRTIWSVSFWRSLAPVEVTEHDILEFDMTSEPVEPFSGMLYSERVMYGAMFRARPDVNAICHHHAPAMLPFCLADMKLCVVTQLGATIGKQVPIWDQRDEFGATNHLVMREDESRVPRKVQLC